ncbi:hypothetical protein PFISCL1PPCAC_25884, partial [Pristionchus fissidentatus]
AMNHSSALVPIPSTLEPPDVSKYSQALADINLFMLEQMAHLNVVNESGFEVDYVVMTQQNKQIYSCSNCNISLIRDYAARVAMLVVLKEQEMADVHVSSLFTVLFTTIFALVGAIGAIGNLLTVWVIYSTTSLHSHTNLFLASLAISDLLLIVVGVPFDILHAWRATDSLVARLPAYCEITSTSISLFTFASTLTIVSLTFERYVAICHPFSLKMWFDRKKVIRLIYAIWFFAAMPSLYIGLQFKRVTRDWCGESHVIDQGRCDYVNYGFTFQIEMASSAVVHMHAAPDSAAAAAAAAGAGGRRVSRMYSTVSNMSAPPASPLLQVHMRDSAPPMSQQAQRMVIKMLFTVTTVFFVCYLPYHLQRFIVMYIKCNSAVCEMLYPITGLLQYVSATLNPIIYNLMSIRFRAAFRRQMSELLLRRKRDLSSIVRI